MKTKISLFVGLVLLLGSNLYAQFVTTGTATTSNLWSGGAVGVGYTTTPTFGTNKFMVSGNSVFTGNAYVTGVAGLGVAPNASYKLGVAGNSYFNGFVGIGAVPNASFRIALVGNSYFNGNVHVGAATAASTRMQITGAAANDSGLRLTNLTNTSTVSTTNNGRVLAVDNLGKVILVNDATAAAATGWDLAGNSGTSAATNFLGTTDNVDLVFRRNNVISGVLSTTNTTFGVNSGVALASGLRNTFIGIDSGKLMTSGNANVFLGDNAGSAGSASSVNVFLGADAGRNATGNANTFVGYDSGGGSYADASGFRNIGIGVNSNFVPLGSDNILIGMNTSTSNTSGPTPVFGNGNTFIGNNISDATVSNSVIIGDGAGNQRIKIDNLGGTTITGLAGTNTGMVVTADDTGKLMMVASSGGSNIYSANGALADDRTVDLASHNLIFSNVSSTTNGKIYIGDQTPLLPTTTGNYKLYVEGGILTEKVRVALRNNVDWADYVFGNGYKLMPLNEVEKYYTVNKHLPNVPSSQEIVEKGLDLAAMQAKQMEKIEELTLYIVAQNKAIEELKLQVSDLLKKQ